jgi:hypothetical protein
MSPRSLAILLLVFACSGRAAPAHYQPVALPGFWLDLPDFVAVEGTPAYSAGQVRGERGDLSVWVAWQNAELDSPVKAQQLFGELMDGKVTARAARATSIGGQRAIEVEGAAQGKDIVFVEIACGVRRVVIRLAGPSSADLRERVLGSFRCHPEGAEESALARPPFGVDDPSVLAGWSRLPGDDAFYLGNGHDIVTFSRDVEPLDDPAALRTRMQTLFTKSPTTWQVGESDSRVALGTQRFFQRGRVVMEGKQSFVLGASWRCTDGVILALSYLDDAAAADAITDLLCKLRCARPDDRALDLPRRAKP